MRCWWEAALLRPPPGSLGKALRMQPEQHTLMGLLFLGFMGNMGPHPDSLSDSPQEPLPPKLRVVVPCSFPQLPLLWLLGQGVGMWRCPGSFLPCPALSSPLHLIGSCWSSEQELSQQGDLAGPAGEAGAGPEGSSSHPPPSPTLQRSSCGSSSENSLPRLHDTPTARNGCKVFPPSPPR